ncbi:fumarylacetoacetate hydrolase family protein [Pedococcus sp. KACC 23699]|uniref:Fumarylacetoacetate hydrolase family protein n=1 Tax=Pedococcus sp. KACC 23699 TaxID=3149228 RepID=A0AAU7JP67_9MICO
MGAPGRERPVAVAPDGTLLDLATVCDDLGPALLCHLTEVARAVDGGDLPVVDAHDGMRWGSPLPRPGKVVGIGLNYADHAAEAGADLPTEPVVFLKATTSVCGPADDIRMLAGSSSTDYEVELGVVVGTTLRDETDPARALEAVAGYVLAHDVSDRAMQLDHGGTWTKGKSADTFCPLGPWLVTPDEVGDPAALRLRLSVNGEGRQDGTTADMVFGVGEVLAYVSRLMTLEPGDLVITGTPAGVAMGRAEPRPYLRHGDVVELDGGVLGRQRSRVVDPAAHPAHKQSLAGTQ